MVTDRGHISAYRTSLQLVLWTGLGLVKWRTDNQGMDTGLPHLKIGDTILQGESTPLIGTEVILGLIRSKPSPMQMRRGEERG